MSPLDRQEKLEAEWRAYRPGGSAPDWAAYLPSSGECSADLLDLLIRTDIEFRIKHGLTALLSVNYFDHPKLAGLYDDALIRNLLAWEMRLRRERGEFPRALDYFARFPNLTIDRGLLPPEMNHQKEAGSGLPAKLGRYRVLARLDRGGFGVVYRGLDEELQRSVAIKVPHRTFTIGSDDGYRVEARILARLDHPNIVPVFDVEHLEDGRLLIVSKFIDGKNFAQLLREGLIEISATVRLIATLADALHYAHLQGLVHRDIKPANILLDRSGRPYLTDFGLALREEDYGKGPQGVGTLQYMSPEQARNEGHRVDGRSDIFSLGVVLYEALTGRRPFQADSQSELREQIVALDPRPPRQIRDTIPKEIERICLKALSKVASERYLTARDFAEDLRSFLGENTAVSESLTLKTIQPPILPTVSKSQGKTIIVPRGLRSFEASDADFFLDLLPGPHDRTGSPESLQFWLHKIAMRIPEETFTVGLLYGPSGCGKSSLVKAGLMPRCPAEVDIIYVEATADLTEERLLTRIRSLHHDVPATASLSSVLTMLRRGEAGEPGRKLLLIVDQFEQWLHAHSYEFDSELVRALRQCDGKNLQCLLLVRDDFWMATTRFMRQLDIRIVEARNAAAVDLFDVRHARKVLTLFGRAHGALPREPQDLTAEQQKFVDQAIAGLSQEGKIVPVRLALFSEMVKSRDWHPGTLRAIGGVEGLGVNFLEEAFSSANAPARQRVHQNAVRAVLSRLLPELGKNIKGNMRSRSELLAASGYSQDSGDFDDLMQILHRELRLISPADPHGTEAGSASDMRSSDSEQFYQLTHDYLVGAVREWLTRKQKETPRGRAELLLEDRAQLYTARPNRRNLPSVSEWATIRWYLPRRTLTLPQRNMLARADRIYLSRLFIVGLALFLILGSVWYFNGEIRSDRLQAQLLDAHIARVPAIIDEMQNCRRWINPKLQAALASAPNPQHELRLRLALLPDDPEQAEHLLEKVLAAEPQDCYLIWSAMLPYASGIRPALDRAFAATPIDPERHLRILACLSTLDSDDPHWIISGPIAVEHLVNQPLPALSFWREMFRPAARHLLEPLADWLSNIKHDDASRLKLTTFYRSLSEGVIEAEKPLWNRIQVQRSSLPTPGDQKVAHLKSQANLLCALLAIERDNAVWPELRHSADPTLRTLIIERCAPCGVSPSLIRKRLDAESDPTIRAALVLSFGQFSDEAIPQTMKDQIAAKILKLFEHDTHPGVHGAAEWLLKRWKRQSEVDEIVRRLRTTSPTPSQHWYINPDGQTLVVLRGRHKYWNLADKDNSFQEMNCQFALSTKEITLAEFQKFQPNFHVRSNISLDPDCAVIDVSWNQAAEYCNWLSVRHGLQPCYKLEKNENATGDMIEFEDIHVRTGYRLPTVSEFLIAQQAGTSTVFACGDVDDLLYGQYAVYYVNSLHNNSRRPAPVGTRKPNGFGFFDLEGNVKEWCNLPLGHTNISGKYNSRYGISVGNSYRELPYFYNKRLNTFRFMSNSKSDDHGFRVLRQLNEN